MNIMPRKDKQLLNFWGMKWKFKISMEQNEILMMKLKIKKGG